MFINCGFLNEIMEITEAKKILQKLIDLYHNYKDDKSFIGNEKQACQSLIIPLIRDILHWNTDNPAEFKMAIWSARLFLFMAEVYFKKGDIEKTRKYAKKVLDLDDKFSSLKDKKQQASKILNNLKQI